MWGVALVPPLIPKSPVAVVDRRGLGALVRVDEAECAVVGNVDVKAVRTFASLETFNPCDSCTSRCEFNSRGKMGVFEEVVGFVAGLNDFSFSDDEVALGVGAGGYGVGLSGKVGSEVNFGVGDVVGCESGCGDHVISPFMGWGLAFVSPLIPNGNHWGLTATQSCCGKVGKGGREVFLRDSLPVDVPIKVTASRFNRRSILPVEFSVDVPIPDAFCVFNSWSILPVESSVDVPIPAPVRPLSRWSIMPV